MVGMGLLGGLRGVSGCVIDLVIRVWSGLYLVCDGVDLRVIVQGSGFIKLFSS